MYLRQNLKKQSSQLTYASVAYTVKFEFKFNRLMISLNKINHFILNSVMVMDQTSVE